jgi:Caspase domain
MKIKNVLILYLILGSNVLINAQVYRALLIGIDTYSPALNNNSISKSRSEFLDLKGCRNDVVSIASILTSKFHFDQRNIDTLINQSASRIAILSQIEQLLEQSYEGDIAFIYYAGHGSQVHNSLSFEANKKDQTIVPADAWKEGIQDIRDKELAKIFNAFIDKKVKLTVIFDCCHSGSISRGPNDSPENLRYMTEANWDSRDASKPAIPELREGNNFLIISATQSDEYAAEQKDDYGNTHGAFTLALTAALNQLSSNELAQNIFSTTRAILKSKGKKQEPIIGGSSGRLQQSLFGFKMPQSSDKTLIAAIKTIGNKVLLQGGYALHLFAQNELTQNIEKIDDAITIRIDTILSLNTSLGTVTKGNIRHIIPGDLFFVSNWVSPKRPLIKLFIPKSNLSEVEFKKISLTIRTFKNSTKAKWIERLGNGTDPYTSIFWKNEKCFIKIDNLKAVEIKEFTVKNLLELCKKDSTIYFELPIDKTNSEKVYEKLIENKNVQIVKEMKNANYTLFGRLGPNGFPAYGFRKVEISSKDSLEILPMQTDCYEINDNNVQPNKNITENLTKSILKIAKLMGWLSLSSPKSEAFPYSFQLSNQKNEPINNYKIGDLVSMKLKLKMPYIVTKNKTKYVYIFGIDQSGLMNLFYPFDDGNVNNKYPKYINQTIVEEILLMNFKIPPPTGVDNYFLLVCEEPIVNPSMVLNQKSITSSNLSRGQTSINPLLEILDIGNNNSRGLVQSNINWSLQRFSFICSN